MMNMKKWKINEKVLFITKFSGSQYYYMFAFLLLFHFQFNFYYIDNRFRYRSM